MKAISIYQPWASAIVAGHKTMETRGWRTKYRGPLAIHASRKTFCWEFELMNASIFSVVFSRQKKTDEEFFRSLPRGGIVGVVQLVDCIRTEAAIVQARRRKFLNLRFEQWWSEADLGNFDAGRWAWILEHPVETKFVPMRGKPGLFDVDYQFLRQAGLML